MNRSIVAVCVAVGVGAMFLWRGATQTALASGNGPGQDTANVDDRPAVVERAVAAMRAKIAAHEKDPAAEVYKNLQVFKTMEAGKLPGLMGNWSTVLGVTCKHCHVVDQWDKEDRPEKQIARDMVHMVGEINTGLLKNIKNLDSPEPRIGCWTCHRGKLIPEFFPPREKKN